MKSRLSTIALAVIISAWSQYIPAVTVNTNSYPQWPDGSSAQGGCSIDFTGYRNLSLKKTLIADNQLPDNSVLYDLGTMLQVSQTCQTNTYSTSSLFTTGGPSILISLRGFTGEYFSTNNPGVYLKLYIKANIGNCQSALSTRPLTRLQTITEEDVKSDIEYPASTLHNNFNTLANFAPYISTGSTYDYSYKDSCHRIVYSLRGELIKIGNILPSEALSLENKGSLHYEFRHSDYAESGESPYTLLNSGVLDIGSLFGSGGITLVAPACRLRGATDYAINLGLWNSGNKNGHPNSFPTYGQEELIDLRLECSGKVNNVNFSFQDTGNAPLTNNNISVYDNLEGSKIDGLEIEMSYNGSRINVNSPSESPDIYKTNTGSHGTTNPSDESFNSQSVARFGARFVQRSTITRDGTNYAGPVTGKVNMFVTYY